MTIDHPLPSSPSQIEENAEGLATPRRPGFIKNAILTQPQAMVGLAIIGFFVFIAIFGSYLEPYSTTAKTGPVYAPPSSAHWLGTDDGGVDMLSLLIAGTKVSLEVGFAAAFVAILVGASLGGLLGAITALPITAAGNVVLRQVMAERRPLAEDNSGPSTPLDPATTLARTGDGHG